MEIHEESLDRAVLVKTLGPLDSSSSPTLEKRLEPLMSTGDASIVLDLSGTGYVSSAGLRVILSAVKALRGSDRRFLLCGVSPGVMEVLSVTGLHRVITIADDLDQALAAL